MRPTSFARKLDDSGRLLIPIRLREKLGLSYGQVYPFYLHEHNDKVYLCIECENYETDLQKAFRILEENGLEIPAMYEEEEEQTGRAAAGGSDPNSRSENAYANFQILLAEFY